MQSVVRWQAKSAPRTIKMDSKKFNEKWKLFLLSLWLNNLFIWFWLGMSLWKNTEKQCSLGEVWLLSCTISFRGILCLHQAPWWRDDQISWLSLGSRLHCRYALCSSQTTPPFGKKMMMFYSLSSWSVAVGHNTESKNSWEICKFFFVKIWQILCTCIAWQEKQVSQRGYDHNQQHKHCSYRGR